ncbi:MAG TPA: hypothetical protein ENN50_04510 [Prosthecochloris aestuarii]|uniref:Glutamate--cysteine ligase GCS2 n=1 Tax=Prosthecochloris aestuarii TaxID=1102 RepID=A0A831SMA2_PROAE|nr:hypothetical protein [Prosthecochloris aestuarii]
MGSEIGRHLFSTTDFKEFRHYLRKETLRLAEWFSDGTFDKENGSCGLELEGWLVDLDFMPCACNEQFLDRVTNPLIVPELSRYNFEINTSPHRPGGPMLSNMHKELEHIWAHCCSIASELDIHTMMIGILPTLRDHHLNLDNVSALERYRALNREIIRSRRNRPLKIHIEGKNDSIDLVHHDVMAEAATTSLQIHIQCSPDEGVRHYNASHILSAPMAAVAANAPVLFGRKLWMETRIPLFEQAVSVPSFTDKHGRTVSRVTFGRDYARRSLLELFLENLDGFDILLPVVSDNDISNMDHLRLHNGTIWRWNRPLVGMDHNGKPHLRIEHRVPSAGPTIPDCIANIAFYYGSLLFCLAEDQPLESLIPFDVCRENFYLAARYGLDAVITWSGGKKVNLQRFILDTLLPGARTALIRAEFDRHDVEHYLDGIIRPRVYEKQTGADWQNLFLDNHGSDTRELALHYHEYQNQQIPVHRWSTR